VKDNKVEAEGGARRLNRELLTAKEGHGRVVVGQEAFATGHAPLKATRFGARCLTGSTTWSARSVMPNLMTWIPRRSRDFSGVGGVRAADEAWLCAAHVIAHWSHRRYGNVAHRNTIGFDRHKDCKTALCTAANNGLLLCHEA
jgi:hypothetical protein